MADIRSLSQEQVVYLLTEFREIWAPNSRWRRIAAEIEYEFPFVMTDISLQAIWESLSCERLCAFLDAEGARDAYGPEIVGHYLAGNAPLLGWSSLLRALLLRSRSLVKLPRTSAANWTVVFKESLHQISPVLADAIELRRWRGGDHMQEAQFLSECDCLLAYGRDESIKEIQTRLPPNIKMLGYGSKFSVGIVAAGADPNAAAEGLALDAALFDQTGCLSAQIIFVEGDKKASENFAQKCAEALDGLFAQWPSMIWDSSRNGKVAEFRAIVQMSEGIRLLADTTLNWTVAQYDRMQIPDLIGCSIVHVVPFHRKTQLKEALTPMRPFLQGCAVAGEFDARDMGFSRICAPGELQRAPLEWHQDGIPPLRSLLIGADCELDL